MATAQERIKQLEKLESQAIGVGLIPAVILGLIVAVPMGREAGAGLFVGLVVWITSWQIWLMVLGRSRGQLRWLAGLGLSLAVYLATFALTTGTESGVIPLITGGIALTVALAYNDSVEKKDKVAFCETKIIFTATSAEEKKKPDAQRRKVDDLQRQLAQAQADQKKADLTRKQPMSTWTAEYKIKRFLEIQDRSWLVALIPGVAAGLIAGLIFGPSDLGNTAAISTGLGIYTLSRYMYIHTLSRRQDRIRRTLTWGILAVLLTVAGSGAWGLNLGFQVFYPRIKTTGSRIMALLLFGIFGFPMVMVFAEMPIIAATGTGAKTPNAALNLWSISMLVAIAVPLLNWLLDRGKVNRYETEIIRAATSAEARKKPASAVSKVQDSEGKRAQFLESRYAGLLAKAERKPMSLGAKRAFARVGNDLGGIEKPTTTQQALLGRAYLGSARHLAAYDSQSALQYVKQAQKYPLPPEGTDFVARYYALTGAADEQAVQAYTSYIRTHKDKPRDPLDTVYFAAQRVCAVTLDSQVAQLKEAESRALGFLAADDRLGWAALCIGQCQLWQGRTAEALPHLTRAVQLMPQSLDAVLCLGQTQLAEKDINAALITLRGALALDPSHVETRFSLGYALVVDGRAETFMGNLRREIVQEAVGHLEAVVAAQPQRAEAAYALGLAYYAGANYRAARTHFERALALSGEMAEWHYQYARSLAALGDYTHAMEAGQQALDRAPKHRGALALMARESIRAGAWTTAEQHYRTMLALDAGDEEANVGLGRALFEEARYDEAVACLQKPTALDTDHERLYYLGRAQSMRGDFGQALTAYQGALDEGGPNAATFYAVGCAYANLSQWQSALKALNESLRIEASSRAYIQQGNVYMATGDRKAAFESYQQATNLSPKLADAHYAIGLYYYLGGDPDTARVGFNNALKCDPDNALAHLGLGAIYEAQGNMVAAQESYTKALNQNPPPTQVLLRVGVVAARGGRSAEAIEPLSKARQSGIETDELLYYLGLAHARLEHWQEAVEAWSLFQQHNPDDQVTLLNLTRCRYHLGHEHFAAGAYAAAAEAWEACAAVYQDDPALKQARIEAYFRQGAVLLTQPDQVTKAAIKNARKAFKRALALVESGDRRLEFFSALATLAEGDYPAAVEALRAMLAADGADANERLTYHLALALHHAGQSDEAVPYFEQALRAPLPPHLRLGAQLAMAGIHTGAGRWAEAAEMYRQAFTIEQGQ